MTTTDKPEPKLTRRWRIAIVAGVLAALAGISIVVVNVTASPAPKSYKVSATGNLVATWFSDATVGQLDMSSGSDTQTVNGRSVSISVDSTLPEGATCRIEGPNGETYVDHVPSSGDAIVTASCSTK